mmetsp:Transcript_16388/g.31155  ORF Transcript_16388/g.31155 Transcript_16388/m.31155 type:complete len:279 (-) Transcript_16388:92-928(-)|eukprot:scaffold1230_cov166-Amphora_coffeaeformis.AAC.4
MDNSRNRREEEDEVSSRSLKEEGDAKRTPIISTGGSDEHVKRGDTESTEQFSGKTRSDGRAYVPKNSLTEEMLLADRNRAREKLKRKKKADVTMEDIAEERKTSNRLSEFQSRQRRKKIVDDLKKTAEEQNQHSTSQSKQIAELQAELQTIRQENLALRQHLQQFNQQAQAPPQPQLSQFQSGAAMVQGLGLLAQLIQNSASGIQPSPPPPPSPIPQSRQEPLTLLQQELANRPPNEAASILRLLQELATINQLQSRVVGDNGSSESTYPPSSNDSGS